MTCVIKLKPCAVWYLRAVSVKIDCITVHRVFTLSYWDCLSFPIRLIAASYTSRLPAFLLVIITVNVIITARMLYNSKEMGSESYKAHSYYQSFMNSTVGLLS